MKLPFVTVSDSQRMRNGQRSIRCFCIRYSNISPPTVVSTTYINTMCHGNMVNMGCLKNTQSDPI